MDYGIALPHLGDDANLDGIAAAVELAEGHGFTDVWVTDHILVNHAAAEDYGRIYEAITTLAWIAGRSSRIRLGTSIIVVPMRNAVLLAKQLATLDALSNGRLIAGFGVRLEPGRVRERRRERSLPRSRRVHRRDDRAVPAPVVGQRPSRSAAGSTSSMTSCSGRSRRRAPDLPIWIGGQQRAGVAPRRAARRRVPRLLDEPGDARGRIPIIRAAAAEARQRPMPRLSARARIELDAGARDFYTMHGSAADVAARFAPTPPSAWTTSRSMFPPRDAGGPHSRGASASSTRSVPLV